MSHLILGRDELRELTGGLTQPAAQLRDLHRQGFYRARRSHVTGQVVLERGHYDSVIASRAANEPAQPRLRQPKLRAA
jgi:hypothetical protein